MKASSEQLEQLWKLQQLIIQQRRLVGDAKVLSSGSSLQPLEAEIAELAEMARNQLMAVEALQQEKKRIDSDLELVEKRIQTDRERLNASSSTKDISGIQHEIEGLEQRKSMLEDTELGILNELDQQKSKLDELSNQKSGAEQRLAEAKQSLRSQLDEMKNENQGLNQEIDNLRKQTPAELLELFDKKLSKGVAIGRLVRSACNACNMNLNSTAVADISSVPADEVAFCPECAAIVIRA
ncbi:MAG: zinc ribbon domain-containing protein [Aquiluna sp.]